MLLGAEVERYYRQTVRGLDVNTSMERREAVEKRRNLSLRWRIFLFVFALNCLLTISISVHHYIVVRRSAMSFVDSELAEGANAVQHFLPLDFLNRATGPDTIDLEEFNQYQKRLTSYAKDSYYAYAYVLTIHDTEKKQIAVLICSDPGEAQPGPKPDFNYYVIVTPPEPVWEVLLQLKGKKEGVAYVDYTSEWGSFRTGYKYFEGADGRPLFAAVDFTLEAVQALLHSILSSGVVMGTLFFVLFGAISLFLSNRMITPLLQLTRTIKHLAKTQFKLTKEARVQLDYIVETRQDEIGELAFSFVGMDCELNRYIEDLKTATAAKERMESELQIGREIQMSFLRKTFPAFETRSDFDLYAILEPAREVGGDLYEFALIDDAHLLLVVGDVSEKGVPAALFMSAAQTILRTCINDMLLDPADILKRLNFALADNNECLMFVTMFCGVLNVPSGKLVYSNGGHNPPLLIRSDRTVEWLEMPYGMVLGALQNSEFTTREIHLGPGDKLLAYTDGVTEAMNESHALYSEAHLLEESRRLADLKPEEMVKALLNSVQEHVQGAPASDDITVLVAERMQV